MTQSCHEKCGMDFQGSLRKVDRKVSLFTQTMKGIPKLILLLWLVLVISIIWSGYSRLWHNAFISAFTLTLTVLTWKYENHFNIKIPRSFTIFIILFIYGTLFLGEVGDFYERFWWWDVFLHGGSALAFGLIGFLGIFMLFQGDRFAAPPLALAILSFCFAVAVGAVWEIFEFSMDQIFGLNMQKSGLIDTMWDLIVDCGGAFIGATSGYLYLKTQESQGPLAGRIDDFIQKNKRYFGKLRSK